MLRWFNRLMPPKWLVIFSLGVLATAWYFGQYVGRLEPMPPDQAEVADRLAQRVAAELPHLSQPAPLVVLPPFGDYTRTLRDSLHQHVAASGKFPILNTGHLGTVLERMGIDAPMPETRESAAGIGRMLGANYVLWGEIEEMGPGADGGFELVVSMALLDREGALHWDARFQESARQTARDLIRSQGTDGSRLGLFLVWFVVLLGLPFLLWPVTRKLIDMDSNSASLALLFLLSSISTALGVFIALFFAEFAVRTALTIVLPLCLLLSVWAIHFICGAVAQMRLRY